MGFSFSPALVHRGRVPMGANMWHVEHTCEDHRSRIMPARTAGGVFHVFGHSGSVKLSSMRIIHQELHA